MLSVLGTLALSFATAPLNVAGGLHHQHPALAMNERPQLDIIQWHEFPARLDSDRPHQATLIGEHESERFRLPRRYSSADWLSILRETPGSTVLRRIKQPVLFSMIFATAVAILYRCVPGLATLSFKPHSLVGSALSLLLVFRTNAAYTRFWEGRQRWTMLSDHCRALSRLVMLYEEQVGRARKERVARLLCAFPIVLKQYLRGHEICSNDVSDILSESDRASLGKVSNKPLHICNLLGKQLAGVPDTPELEPVSFSARERLAMLSKVSSLSDCIGACERIVQTPVPLHYARHTSRLATLFVNTLPFCLARELGFLLVPTMGVICWALFGIQEIGLMIEEPFREVIKLDSICQTIHRDVLQTLQQSDAEPDADVTHKPEPKRERVRVRVEYMKRPKERERYIEDDEPGAVAR